MELNVKIGQRVKCKSDGVFDKVVDYRLSESHEEGHAVCIKKFARTDKGITSNQWYNIKKFLYLYEA